MSDVLAVRPAQPGDGDILGEIHVLSWGVSHGPLRTPKGAAAGIEERRTKWHGIPAEGVDTILPARLNERPGAFARFGASTSRPGLAEIHAFFTHPDFWGAGEMADAEAQARVREAGGSRPEVVRPGGT